MRQGVCSTQEVLNKWWLPSIPQIYSEKESSRSKEKVLDFPQMT